MLLLAMVLRDSLDAVAASVLIDLKSVLDNVLDRTNLFIDLFFHVLSIKCKSCDFFIIHGELRFHHFH